MPTLRGASLGKTMKDAKSRCSWRCYRDGVTQTGVREGGHSSPFRQKHKQIRGISARGQPTERFEIRIYPGGQVGSAERVTRHNLIAGGGSGLSN